MSRKRKAVSYRFAEVTQDINGDFVDRDALFEERNKVITEDSAPPTAELPLWSQNWDKYVANNDKKWEWSEARKEQRKRVRTDQREWFEWFEAEKRGKRVSSDKWEWFEAEKQGQTVKVRIYLI